MTEIKERRSMQKRGRKQSGEVRSGGGSEILKNSSSGLFYVRMNTYRSREMERGQNITYKATAGNCEEGESLMLSNAGFLCQVEEKG